jgi:hypothetical protein
MATNFPGSADSFTNPTSGSSLSSPSHADQHTNVNDAVEAIETALLDGAPLHIDDVNERVGIGTTSPSTALEVSDVSPATITLKSENTIVTAGAEVQAIDFYQSDASGGAGVSARIVGVGNNSSGAQNLTFHTGQAGASSVAERVRIDSNGNVGIGTDSPTKPLHVYSASTDQVARFASGDTRGGIEFADSGTTNSVKIGAVGNDFVVRTGSVDVLTVTDGGLVGIGTSAPSYKLDVNGITRVRDDVGYHDGTNSAGYISTTKASGASNKLKIVGNRGLGGIDIEANQGRAMTVKYNAFVGFGGATNPLAPLHVKRGSGTNTGVGSGGNYAAIIYYATDSPTSHGLQVLNNWQADASKLLDMGSIAANSAGYAQRWYATGLGRSYNYYGTWGSISDETLKTEIVDANPQLQDILDLRFVNYKFIADVEQQGDDAPRLFGLIAQEVEAVSPGLVSSSAGDTEGDAKKTINTSVLSMKAVKAMQEIYSLVQTQQETIDTLTARVETLEVG